MFRLAAALALAVALPAGAQVPELSRESGSSEEVREQITWKVIESGPFEVHVPGEDMVPAAREAAAWLLEAQTRMEKELDFELEAPVRVIIYRSRLQARQSLLLQEAPGELGGLLSDASKRRILLPLSPSPRSMQRTLEHQLAHVMMEQKHFGRSALSRSILEYKSILYPSWVLEGIAESLSLGDEPAAEMLFRDAALDDALPDLSEMHGVDSLNAHEFPQHQAHARFAVRWIARKTPRGSVKRLFNVFNSDLPFPTARLIRRATGMSYNEVEQGVKRDIIQAAREWSIGREEPETFATRVRPARHYYRVFEQGAAWSPDGKRVAFFDDREGYYDITLVDVASGDTESLLSVFLRVTIDAIKAQERGLDWSPDGGSICFVGDRVGRAYLYIKSLRGAGLRRIALPFDDVSQPQYSPRGNTIVFVGVRAGRADLYTLDLERLEVSRLTRHEWPESDPAWSADGTKIAYSGETDGQFDVFVMDLATGGVERVTSGASNETAPTFRPDGRALTFASDAGGAFNLWSVDLETRKFLRHTNVVGGAFAPRWRPDGSSILFASYRHGRFAASIMAPREAVESPQPDDADRAAANRRYFTRQVEDFRVREYTPKLEFESILPTGAELADLFKNHRFDSDIDYRLQSGGHSLKGEISYENRMFRTDLNAAVFGSTDVDSETSKVEYGLKAEASYPIDRFTRISLGYFIAHEIERVRDENPEEGIVDEDTIQSGVTLSVSRRNIVKRRRDNVAGYSVSFSVQTLLPELGSDLSRVNYNGELRGYYEIHEDYVLAARLRAQKSNGHDADQLNLKRLVRAYESGEPRGTDLWAFTAEFRFPVWRDINWALPGQIALVKDLRSFVFFDIAVISDEENLLNMIRFPVKDEWHHAVGLGVRLDTYLMGQTFIPIVLTISKATDNTEEAPSSLKYEVTFELDF